MLAGLFNSCSALFQQSLLPISVLFVYNSSFIWIYMHDKNKGYILVVVLDISHCYSLSQSAVAGVRGGVYFALYSFDLSNSRQHIVFCGQQSVLCMASGSSVITISQVGSGISVETGSGHPGHIFSGSSGSDPVYNLSGSDPDWIT